MDLHTVIVAGVAFVTGITAYGVVHFAKRTKNTVDDRLAELIARAAQDPDVREKLVAFLERLVAPKAK